METITTAITHLKSSPLFQLSLSSKELFHSNFLAWVAENHPQAFGAAIARALDIPEGAITRAGREEQHIDLTLSLADQEVFVENKVKSVPSERQLNEYRQKHQGPNRHFLLLSLLPPDREIPGWSYWSYEKLAGILETVAAQAAEPYHRQLLLDYTGVARNLHALSQGLTVGDDMPFGDFYGASFWQFKEIRLHDLYIKHLYSRLAARLTTRLQDAALPVPVRPAELHQTGTGEITVFTNLMNGKGILHAEYGAKEGILFGVMLDGTRYLQYIVNNTAMPRDEKIKFADGFRHSGQWFCFDEKLLTAPSRKKAHEYNRFGDGMLCRSALIPEDMPVDGLEAVMVGDMRRAVGVGET